MRQRASIVIAAAFALVGLAYLIAGQRYPVMQHDQPGPGLYPLLVGVFWLLAGVACTFDAWREGATGALAFDWPARAGWRRILVVLASCGVYVALVGVLGDLLMTFVVVLAVTRAMGMQRPIHLLATALSSAIVWHLVFVTALHVPLPQGVWAG